MRLDILIGIARVLIGGIFLISGAGKLLQPYQNFLYVIEQYDFLPTDGLETLAAMVMPWLELLAGGFLILGLWTRAAVLACWVMTTGFLFVLGQALWRRLPLENCGCFGELIKVPAQVTFGIDALMWLALAVFWFRRGKVFAFSMDCFLSEKGCARGRK